MEVRGLSIVRWRHLRTDEGHKVKQTMKMEVRGLSIVRSRYLHRCDSDDFSPNFPIDRQLGCIRPVHSFKSWNQVVAGLPLRRLPSVFPCINLFSRLLCRTKNLILLSATLFLNVITDTILSNTHREVRGKKEDQE